jgi:hypothetical protein
MALALTKTTNASASGTITPVASAAAEFEYTLGGNLTLNAPSSPSDSLLVFTVKGPASGSFTIAFAPAYVGIGSRVLGVGDVFMCAFIYNGSLLLPIGNAMFSVDRAN